MMSTPTQKLPEAASFLTFLLLSTTQVSQGKIIDLSHVQTPETFYFAGNVPYARTHVSAGQSEFGVYVDSGVLRSPEHSGTHIDSPSHFVEGAPSLDELPVESTIADGVTIDCRAEARRDREYQVTVQKLLDWENQYGRIPEGAAVLMQFGWSFRFGNITDYLGSEDLENLLSFHVPSVSKEAGEWLLNERDVRILGVDSLSPDPLAGAPDFANHLLFLGNRRILVENLKIPDHMPARGFRFHATPPKYLGGSGTQVRAFAMTLEEDDVSDKTCAVSSSFCLLFGAFLAMWMI